MTAPLQGWHFETARVNGGRFFPLKILSLGRDRRFGVRSYCVREERQVTLRLWSASALVSLHIFSHCAINSRSAYQNKFCSALTQSFISPSIPKKMGIPRLPQTTHLPYPPFMAAVVEQHEKRPALPEKLKELQTKGRKLTQNSKNNGTIQSQNRVHIQWLLRHRG